MQSLRERRSFQRGHACVHALVSRSEVDANEVDGFTRADDGRRDSSEPYDPGPGVSRDVDALSPSGRAARGPKRPVPTFLLKERADAAAMPVAAWGSYDEGPSGASFLRIYEPVDLLVDANAALGRPPRPGVVGRPASEYWPGPGVSAASPTWTTSARRAEVPKPPVPLLDIRLNDFPADDAIEPYDAAS